MKKILLVCALVASLIGSTVAANKTPMAIYSGRLRTLQSGDTLYHDGVAEFDTLTLNIADGNTPMTITSTTVVANLNVDQVDGLDASATATASKLYALDGAAKWALGVIPQLPDSKLNTITTADKVSGSAVQLNAAGAIVDSTGLMVQLDDSNPGLQIASNKLCLKINASGALEEGASGLGIKLEASNPSLQISSNELGVKIKAAGGLAKDASGLYVLDTGTDAATLTADTSALAVGNWVYVSGNGTVALADADDDTKNVIGVVTVANATGTVVVSGLATGLSGLTANTAYYLSETAGTYTSTAPTTAGSIVQTLGWGWNATTMMVCVNSYPVLN